jgi:murein DD-endopeptidase MepM/ murein hydrolase activator NlpD
VRAAPEAATVVSEKPSKKAAPNKVAKASEPVEVENEPKPVAVASIDISSEKECLVCQPTGLPLVVSSNEPVYVTCRFRDSHQPQHNGLDFPTDKYTEVRTTHDGMVVTAAYDPLYGNLVVIENWQWKTHYAHHAYLLVREGDQVQAGDLIGLVGNTGDSSGDHLHYEVRDARGTARDPENYLDGMQLRFAPCTNEEKE